MKKIIALGLMTAGLATMAFGANRVGPVSQYGQLQAGKNAAGKGRIYGSCPAYSTSGNEVAVQGMSLFWSMTKTAGINFWNGDVIKGLVDKHKIQLIRAPMGVDGSWEDDVGNYYTNAMHETAMNAVVQAAIDNDIYVLIDYHSHCAEKNTAGATQFFGKMAQKWGKYDNVIFEIYNEPKHGDCNEENPWYDAAEAKNYWKSNIYPYANAVISEIRKYSDNLVVVGTPYYDQYVDAAAVQPINDKNVAYTFHYYAGEEVQNSEWTHKVDVLGKNPENMMNKGYSVFVTEWGNSGPSGDGGFTKSYSTTWYNWMKTNQLSGANWSVSNKAETASYFTTGVSASTPSSQWSYTESGSWTNENVFAALPATYKACDGSSAPSSDSQQQIASSSSQQQIASSSAQQQAQSSSAQQQVANSSAQQQITSSASQTVTGGANVSGSLNQTVAQGGTFNTITITGVSSFNRDTYSAYFLQVKQEGDKVTISTQGGAIDQYLNTGDYSDTFTVNGEKLTLNVKVVAAGTEIASSDSQAPASSATAALAAVQKSYITVAVAGRMLNIAGVTSADVDLFDLQGRPMVRLKNVVGSADLSAVPSGNYIVRVRSGAVNMTRKVNLR
ncbi:Por secretion system C-terminal sorting domain-containing protein [Fibrobacter sp. UWH9]|uniref:cellulase family glycosylhydrolase n=1 Tax=Fibrobacter sp. UWH9 TaxID=1896213 RepID=UPI00091E62A6|nr:cellulase family glycosylhydrolase [Fibrobacter sp. UWH9]SHH65892.1 Por secretion system C-terminal sorting domain-containing protein [Fibrobacter sp. UWH9]